MRKHLDFVLHINEDAVPGRGEDSWCHSFSTHAGILGVFDGCGGSGSGTHAWYSGHTEAFIASRLCAGAFLDAFQDSLRDGRVDADEAVSRCGSYSSASLQAYRPPAQAGQLIRSSLLTTLPTTAAAAIVQAGKDRLDITAVWAGDSRVYLLTPDGLSQLSDDDAEGDDPFDTDGMMTNTINADKPIRLHTRRVRAAYPVLVLAATDGCFAYEHSPMEFEGVLLTTLAKAASPAAWEVALADRIGLVAGDDFTMALAAFGFGSYLRLRQALAPRTQFLHERYLAPISALAAEDSEGRRALWAAYRAQYCKYIEGT